MNPNTRSLSNTRKLTEGALMVALATILSFITIYHLPQGGNITALSMLPIILMSYRNGLKWGIFTGFAYSLVQLLIGFHNVMYMPTLLRQIGCILLDYIIPFTFLGTACFFAKPFKNQIVGIGVSTFIVCFVRFICSFLSGILLFGAYAPEGTPVWLYSLVYNGSYMLPETILTIIGAILICKSAKKLFNPKAA